MVNARISSLLGKITVLVMVCFVVNTALALSGSGTEQDPWRIKSLEDFNDFAADPNYWAGFTRLETDVNLAGRVYHRAVITYFNGVFDGNDHKIINLTIDRGDILGLFGIIYTGEVRNLGIEGGSVSGSVAVGGLVAGIREGTVLINCYSTCDVNSLEYSFCAGGLVGGNLSSTIINCYSTGHVSVSGACESVGGLVGSLEGGTVSNCSSTGDVIGSLKIGGLVGGNFGGTIISCFSTGTVSGIFIGGNHVGGLIGYLEGGYVSNCYSTGVVKGIIDFDTVGGLVGSNRSGTINNCCSTGDASNGFNVGGLVGDIHEGTVSNCYSTGNVIANVMAGGLVGCGGGSILNCYSTGDVGVISSGYGYAGGLVGMFSDSESVISNCFWDTDTQTHGVTESFGVKDGDVNNVEGLPTTQMQTKGTFTDADWDFINVWNIGENQTYPYLRIYLPSDINKDGIVNFFDFAVVADQWMEEK